MVLPLPTKRFLTLSEAAAYLGVSVSTFKEEVAAGRWPPPMRRGRTGRALTWDIRALDRAADLVSGIAAAPHDAEAAGRSAETLALERFRNGAPKVYRPQYGPAQAA